MGKKSSITPSDAAAVKKKADGSFWSRLCTGDAGCLLNLACCPLVFLFNSSNIYLLPCIGIYLRQFVAFVFCGVFRRLPFCGWCFRHTDKKFKANASSIGKWKDKEGSSVDELVKWERAQSFYQSRLTDDQKKKGVRVKLFERGIEPKDVAQGQVGNCWLIAALACIAENPGLVRKAFVTKVASSRGKYAVRLFDWQKRRWTTITVDENIPVTASDRQMLFAQPNGHELWVSMIEKGFAKFVGTCTRSAMGHAWGRCWPLLSAAEALLLKFG